MISIGYKTNIPLKIYCEFNIVQHYSKSHDIEIQYTIIHPSVDCQLLGKYHLSLRVVA